MRTWEIWNPEAMGHPDMEALFDRAFADPKFEMDATDVREYIHACLDNGDKETRLLIANDSEHGLCGLAIVTLGTYPLSPLPYVAFLHVDEPAARVPLVELCCKVVREAGYTRFAAVNETGRSNGAMMRLVRDLLVGRVRGSLIFYDVREPNGG